MIVTYGIWAIDPTSLSNNQGVITGTVTGPSGQPVVGQRVTLYDNRGDPVNVAVTKAGGVYSFGGLYSSASSPGLYIVQFAPPAGDGLVLAGDYTQVTGGNKTVVVSVASGQTVHIDAYYIPFTVTSGNYQGFQLGAPGYSVVESVQGGLLAVTIIRNDASRETPVVLHTFDGTAGQNLNYTRVSTLLEFAVGVTSETVYIPILNTNSIQFAAPALTFTLVLRTPTGQPLDRAVVSIGGQGFGLITDDDIIHGGAGINVMVGDSGYVQPPSSLGPLSDPANSNITYTGGPGNDTIFGGIGPTYINGELGNDLIYAGLGAETIDGGFGSSAIIANQEVSTVILASSVVTPNSGTLTFKNGSTVLGTATFTNIRMAELLGGSRNTTLELNQWQNPAWVFAGNGGATLNVVNDTNMTLADVNLAQGQLFKAVHGFLEVATLTLGNGAIYALGGLANVSLTGGANHDTLDASGYSKSVTFHGSAGGGVMQGGAGQNRFAFDASTMGAYAINSAGGIKTLDFSGTPYPTSITLNLTLPANTVQPSLPLILNTSIQNVITGQGNNTINASSGIHQIILRPYTTQQTVTVTGNGGNTTLDFSAFKVPITVNLHDTTTAPIVASGSGWSLGLHVTNVNNVIGGAAGGTLTGNAANDTFTLTGGINAITGNSSSANNTVNASADANFSLTSNSFSVGGVGNSLANIQTVNLIGGAGNNVFQVNGFPGTANITGNGGSNTVEVQTNVSGAITVTNSAITYSGATITLHSIAGVSITDIAGGVTFDATGWTAGNVTVGGGVGRNATVAAQASPGETIKLANSSITLGNGSVISLNSIQNAVLYGSGNSTLDASLFTGTATLKAGAGGDRFIAGSGNETLIGGVGKDTFVFAQSATAQAVTVTGNGGSDTLDFSSFTAQVNVDLSRLTSQPVTSELNLVLPNADIQNLISGHGGGVVTGNALNNTFTITGGPNTINGGSGNNTVSAQATASGPITLANSVITLDNSSTTATLTAIQNAIISACASGNTFSLNLAGWPAGAVTLNGGASGTNSFTLLPQSGSSPPTVKVNVNGAGGNNILDVSAFSGVTHSLTQMPSTVDLTVTDIQTKLWHP